MAEKKTATITDSEIDALAVDAGSVLASQPKVKIRIPVDRLNPKDLAPVPVCVNGYTYFIKRGETVSVPETVAQILEESGYM